MVAAAEVVPTTLVPDTARDGCPMSITRLDDVDDDIFDFVGHSANHLDCAGWVDCNTLEVNSYILYLTLSYSIIFSDII